MATWTIYKRELGAIFASPVAYLSLTAWTVTTGLTFVFYCSMIADRSVFQAATSQESPLTYFFGQSILMYIPLLLIVPVVTMNLLAEERARGTLEVLLTAPVSETAVVLGKYLAALTFWVALLAPSLLYVWLTSYYGDVDLGAVAASYLGLFGIGAYFLAVGTAASAVAPTQVVSAVLTFGVLCTLFMLGLAHFVVADNREIYEYISIWGHMSAFSQGIVDTRYLVFDVTITAVFLVIAVAALSARRVNLATAGLAPPAPEPAAGREEA